MKCLIYFWDVCVSIELIPTSGYSTESVLLLNQQQNECWAFYIHKQNTHPINVLYMCSVQCAEHMCTRAQLSLSFFNESIFLWNQRPRSFASFFRSLFCCFSAFLLFFFPFNFRPLRWARQDLNFPFYARSLIKAVCCFWNILF